MGMHERAKFRVAFKVKILYIKPFSSQHTRPRHSATARTYTGFIIKLQRENARRYAKRDGYGDTGAIPPEYISRI